LVLLKGIGIKNLQLLERVGINSIPSLASQNPDTLYRRIERSFRDKPIPAKAKLKIWIREAQKRVQKNNKNNL
jgi:predicted RecB family nuclease